MVHVSGGDIGRDWDVWLIDELVVNICQRFGGAAEQVWEVNPPHGKNEVYAEEDIRVRRKHWDYVGEESDITCLKVAAVKGIGDVPLGEVHEAVGRVRLPNML